MMRLWVALTAALALVPGRTDAQPASDPPAEAQVAALASLSTFRDLIDEQNYKEMGLRSLQERSVLALGRSLRVFWVSLDSLKHFTAGGNPDHLLSGGNKYLYPVAVRDSVRASIAIEKVNGRWQPTMLGGAKVARSLFKVQPDSILGSLSAPRFAVEVPALGILFTAYRTGGALMLVPLVSVPNYQCTAGHSARAEEVFRAIASSLKPPPD